MVTSVANSVNLTVVPVAMQVQLQTVQGATGATQHFMSTNSQHQCVCGEHRAPVLITHPQLVDEGSHWHSESVERHSSTWNGFTAWDTVKQQPGDPVLIPSLQVLNLTAVNHDLVLRHLDELHQQLAPQQAGNLSSTLL